jgi:UDP-glucose 4-epimerase|tara:strand:- start:2184 stop:3047 length:864 start_codon:yes stop_codon:yes gene_type:complete
MNIALTGSSGLIGSRLLVDLKNLNYNFFCISSSQSIPEKNIYSYEDMLLGKVSQTIDCIIHLASLNSSISEVDIPLEIEITKNVIRGMSIMGCKKIIFFSTSKVYGDNSFADELFSEISPLNPSCSYSKAKVECENLISKTANNMNYSFLIFRVSPVLINDPSSTIGKLFKFIENGMPIPSFKAGDSNLRSFASYEFIYSVIAEALTAEPHVYNSTFNISNIQAISTNELFRMMALTMKKNARIIYLPNFIFKAMIKVNRLQLILCRLFGNFNMSNTKLLENFDLKS